MNIFNVDNFSKKEKKFINLEKDYKVNLKFMEILRDAGDILFNEKARFPKNRLPEIKQDLSYFTNKDENNKYIWLGHSTILMNVGGQIILTDPIFSKNASPFNFGVKRFQKPLLSLEDLPNIDVITISHNHYDHLDKETIKYFKNKTTNFLVPLGVGAILQKWGIPSGRITELNWYGSKKIGNSNFTATPSRHFSGRGLSDSNKTLWVSWVIEGGNEKIYFSGDSSYGRHFKDIGNRFGEFDIAFVENGQYDKKWPLAHMMPEETIQAVKDLNAKIFVPIHWGMFSLSLHSWSEPIERSYNLSKENGINILTPKLGEILDKSSKTVLWWKSILNNEEIAANSAFQNI